jgi:NOL1/NOP2/sun family putative RNA methylase
VALPASFIDSLQNIKGFDKDAFQKIHESNEQVTSIRFNPAKSTSFPIAAFHFQLSKVSWSTNGFYLSERPSFTLDPLFHAGLYYVQEASSMFLEQAIRQTADVSKPIKILDLCAAPGGKSTLIQSLLNDKSLLVSNEVIKTRANILTENIIKWGAANVIVTNNDPKDFQRLPNYFDAIVVDAPCSGSGLFRKDPNAIAEWSVQNVQLCSQRQQRIIADVMPSLKEGGVLIYSTCSYSAEEDEAIADWLVDELKMESLQLKVDEAWGIVETASEKHAAAGYRFYPDKVKGEGFFIAAFRKLTMENREWKTGKMKQSEKLAAKEIDIVRPYLKNADGFFFIKQNEEAIAMPMHLAEDLSAIQQNLYIKKAGVRMGCIIRNDLIPHHELAAGAIIHPDIPVVEADKATALQYLRRQDIQVETAIKGWSLISYQQLPLGWAKILAGRINNYYPKDWRILNK